MIQEQEAYDLKEVKNVFRIQDDLIDFYWGDILEGLKMVPHYFEYYSPEWTYAEIKSGRLLVWALSDGTIRGIVLSRILLFPRKKVFSILAIYGVAMLDFFNEMEDVFMRVAQKLNCDTISAQCRPGLKRKLRGFRAEEEAIVMYRAVPKTGDQ